MAIRDFFARLGLPPGDLNDLPDSPKRFPDGAQYRVEIPSTEGPRCLEAVLEQAERARRARPPRLAGLGRVHADGRRARRVGAARGRRRGSRCRSSPGPNAAWGLSATARAHAGFAAAAHGQEQLVANLEDCLRAAEHGFRSVLIADLGVLAVFGEARTAGRAAGRHAGEGLGDAAGRERGGGARARTPRRVDDQPADRPDARRRSRRSAPRSTCRSTSTSRRRTTSAASSATTRSRS